MDMIFTSQTNSQSSHNIYLGEMLQIYRNKTRQLFGSINHNFKLTRMPLCNQSGWWSTGYGSLSSLAGLLRSAIGPGTIPSTCKICTNHSRSMTTATVSNIAQRYIWRRCNSWKYWSIIHTAAWCMSTHLERDFTGNMTVICDHLGRLGPPNTADGEMRRYVTSFMALLSFPSWTRASTSLQRMDVREWRMVRPERSRSNYCLYFPNLTGRRSCQQRQSTEIEQT